MNTYHTITPETLERAVERLSRNAVTEGFTKLEAVHSYKDRNNKDLYHRIRRKDVNGNKWIRPIYLSATGQYSFGEPPEVKDLPKPLYELPLISQCKEAIVYVLEGEWPVDWLNKFFFDHHVSQKYIAITSGSATSAVGADWQPLAGRTCVLWADNDEPGQKYITQVSEILINLGCSIQHINVVALQLRQGGDCVDWLRQ